MPYKKTILLLVILCFVIGFLSYSKKDLTYSYYHWKNTFDLKENQDKIYIKALDIDYSKKLEVIRTKFNSKPKNDFVPVIYISNKAIKEADLSLLVKNILEELKALPYSYDELQFDCDWSLSTRAKYFDLLEEIKKNTKKKLSATIRLHQIKYAKKTGIPPVDYGVLMYYNMSDIVKYDTKNSILDNEIARKYHFNFDIYPLRLKLALPLYSQAIQFRNKEALSIFEGVIQKDFEDKFTLVDDNYYEVNKSFYFKGRYIYKGDTFRYEDSSLEEIKIALEDFFDLANDPFYEVIFYSVHYKNKYDLNRLKH